MAGNIRGGMKIEVFPNKGLFHYNYTILTIKEDGWVDVEYGDGGRNEIGVEAVISDIEAGAKVTFPKQDTLKLIKKYLR